MKGTDAESLIADARARLSARPLDDKEIAKKLWLAAAFALKKYYLNIFVNLTTRNSMKYFSKLAFSLAKGGATRSDAWRHAEE